MTERLTLFGQKHLFTPHSGRSFHADLVLGLQRENGSGIMLDGSHPKNFGAEKIKRINLTVGQKAIERFFRFFEMQDKVDFDCTGFAAYVSGVTDELHRGQSIKGKLFSKNRVYSNDLEEGVVYGITDTQGRSVHTLIGGPKPVTSISVLGKQSNGGGILVHMANPVVMDVYEGVSVNSVVDTEGLPVTLHD